MAWPSHWSLQSFLQGAGTDLVESKVIKGQFHQTTKHVTAIMVAMAMMIIIMTVPSFYRSTRPSITLPMLLE